MVDEKNRWGRIDRRGFLQGLAALPVTCLSEVGVTGQRTLRVDARETPKLISGAETIQLSSLECNDLTREILAKKLTKVSASQSISNPYYGDDVGSANPASLHATQVVLERLGLTSERVEILPDLTTIPEGLVMSFGGPNNNILTRAIQGTGRGSPLIRLLGTSGMLPVMFDVERPLEPVVGDEPRARVLVNGIDQDWSQDCLVLTVLPNVYSLREGLEERIVVIAGRHRAGTIAIGHVLSDAHLLERIWRQTRDYLAWQALIPVQTSDLRTPKRLGEEHVFEITADFDALRAIVRGKPFLANVQIPGYEALLASALAARPQEPLDCKWGVTRRIEQEASPNATIQPRSDAVRRSGEGAFSAAPQQEQQSMNDPEDSGFDFGRFLEEPDPDREPAFSEEALKRMLEIAKTDPKRSVKILQELGILDENGQVLPSTERT